MSKSTRWTLVYAIGVITLLVLAFACATGGQSDTLDAGDTSGKKDASVSVKQDGGAPPPSDARPDGSVVVQDAFVPQDAPPSSLFCMAHTECTVSGECCVSLGGPGFCAPGSVVLGVCFPE
jgi:hypothetical protein